VALQGSRQLKARLNAIRQVFKPIGRDWADEFVRLGRSRVPSKTGRLRRSMRRKNATMRKATVAAHFTAFFIDAGTKPHRIVAKRSPALIFQAGGKTIFTRAVNHRGYRARPFRARTAREALKRTAGAEEIIALWNKAA
jgi:hypothetical protein